MKNQLKNDKVASPPKIYTTQLYSHRNYPVPGPMIKLNSDYGFNRCICGSLNQINFLRISNIHTSTPGYSSSLHLLFQCTLRGTYRRHITKCLNHECNINECLQCSDLGMMLQLPEATLCFEKTPGSSFRLLSMSIAFSRTENRLFVEVLRCG